MIDYIDPDIWRKSSVEHDLVITDGNVVVSGTTYTVTDYTVLITNNIIDAENFELHQSICSDTQLTFGSCESAYIKFKMLSDMPTIKGKTLKVYVIPDKDASKILQMGVFKVSEDKMISDTLYREIMAYDALYDILNSDVASLYNDLLPNASSTITLAQLRFAVVSSFGLTQETISLPNDSLIIKRTIEPETLSGADLIKAICELEGCFGVISNTGEFKYVILRNIEDNGLFPSDEVFPAPDLYPRPASHAVIPQSRYISVNFGDYLSEGITQLIIKSSDDDAGVTYGEPGNTYTINGNFLIFGATTSTLNTVGNNILNVIKNHPYFPCTVEALGDPLREVGDPLCIHSKYRTVLSYVLERNLRGIHAFKDTYTAKGAQFYDTKMNMLTSQIKKLANKTTKVEVDVDHFKVEVSEEYVTKDGVVTDLNTKMSGITITPNSIVITSSGTFTVNSSNFNLSSSGVIRLETDTDSGTDFLLLSVGTLSQAFTYNGSGVTQSSEISNGEINVFLGTNLSNAASKARVTYRSVSVQDSSSSATLLSNNLTLTSGANSTSITPTGITINSHPVLTDESYLRTPNIIGEISRDASPMVKFGKYLSSHGTSDDYTLELQSIVINGHRYVMYASQQT